MIAKAHNIKLNGAIFDMIHPDKTFRLSCAYILSLRLNYTKRIYARILTKIAGIGKKGNIEILKVKRLFFWEPVHGRVQPYSLEAC